MKKVKLCIQYSWKKAGFEKFFEKNKEKITAKISIYNPVFLQDYSENFDDIVEIYLKYISLFHFRIEYEIIPKIQDNNLIFICDSQTILDFLDYEKQEYLRVLQVEARQSKGIKIHLLFYLTKILFYYNTITKNTNKFSQTLGVFLGA